MSKEALPKIIGGLAAIAVVTAMTACSDSEADVPGSKTTATNTPTPEATIVDFTPDPTIESYTLAPTLDSQTPKPEINNLGNQIPQSVKDQGKLAVFEYIETNFGSRIVRNGKIKINIDYSLDGEGSGGTSRTTINFQPVAMEGVNPQDTLNEYVPLVCGLTGLESNQENFSLTRTYGSSEVDAQELVLPPC